MKNNIVVYTALFGNYSGIIEQPKIKGVDYICYTDQDITSKSWTVKKVDPPIPGDNTRSNRYYKLLPHKHLKEYEISVYIDANYLIVGDFVAMVQEKLRTNTMLCFDHNQTIWDIRNCIYKEHDELVNMATNHGIYRDSLEDMQAQIDFFKQENYPENNGLIFAAVLIRKHFNKDVVSLMELWWDFVKNKSRRDQLSFNYAVWKLNFTQLEYLKGDLRSGNPWFYWIDHKLDFKKDIQKIKRRKRLEKIFSEAFLTKTEALLKNLFYTFKLPYFFVKIPFWYQKRNSKTISFHEYCYILKKSWVLKLTKPEIKNLTSK